MKSRKKRNVTVMIVKQLRVGLGSGEESKSNLNTYPGHTSVHRPVVAVTSVLPGSALHTGLEGVMPPQWLTNQETLSTGVFLTKLGEMEEARSRNPPPTERAVLSCSGVWLLPRHGVGTFETLPENARLS